MPRPSLSAPAEPLGGRGVALALVPLLAGLPGPWLAPRLRRRLLEAQAEVFNRLQALDDQQDGQAQAAGPLAGPPLEALEPLRPLLPSPFWRGARRLWAIQRRSAAWEQRWRSAPLRPFDRRLLRALGAKAALLRWPALALDALDCRGRRPRLRAGIREALADRLLTAAVLLDDLGDFEADFAARQVNAVLCAGEVRTARPLAFHPGIAAGAARVCAAGIALLSPPQRAWPSTALAMLCARLQVRFREIGPATLGRCQARSIALSLQRLRVS